MKMTNGNDSGESEGETTVKHVHEEGLRSTCTDSHAPKAVGSRSKQYLDRKREESQFYELVRVR